MNPEQLFDMEMDEVELDDCIDKNIENLARLVWLKFSRKNLSNFEDLEIEMRDFLLLRVGPKLTEKIIEYLTGIKKGKKRELTTIVGKISITDRQAKYFEFKSHVKYSPKMEKNAMLICANESYQRAEDDLAELTGIKINHSTLHRLVQRQNYELPTSVLGVKEVELDGGKARIRTEQKGQACEWKDYQAVSLDGIYCGAFFQEKSTLIDWVNCQKLLNPFYCLGDGHPGIWNLFKQVGESEQRIEILDWYHLKENLHKVGGSLKKIKKAENLLWSGKVSETILLFNRLKKKAAQNFCNYLEKHCSRIVDYQYYQLESVSSIGSGSIESVIKRIGTRVKLSGAQWNISNVPKILSLRCAYLNGTFYK